MSSNLDIIYSECLSSFTCVISSDKSSFIRTYPLRKEEYLSLYHSNMNIEFLDKDNLVPSLSINYNSFISLSDELELLDFILSLRPSSLTINHNFSDKSLCYFLENLLTRINKLDYNFNLIFARNRTYKKLDFVDSSYLCLYSDIESLSSRFLLLVVSFGSDGFTYKFS